MSSCLNDARVQAVADGEGTAREIEHVRTCESCNAQVEKASDAMRDFGRMMAAVSVPTTVRSRVAVAAGREKTERGGATTLRGVRPFRPRPAWVFAGGAVAAIVVALLFVVLPSVDPGTRLNAAEILDRSLQTLAVRGTERLEYELSLQAPSAITVESGTYRIEQVIDHESGRWRFARFSNDGTLLNGIREEPATGLRELVIRHDGRVFRFRFAVAADERVPLWDVQRRYAEAMIRLVQASAGQVVSEEVVGNWKRYVVELGETQAATASPLFDLAHARVVVDASDFHIVEFSARGALMGEEISIGYRLIQRSVSASPPPASDFELPGHDQNGIELQADGTRHAPFDLLSLLLREVARSR